MKFCYLFILTILLFLLPGCKKESSSKTTEPKPITLTLKDKEVITRSNQFGIDLFKATSADSEGNLMLSPLSASTALTMLLNGCNNSTYTQIQEMLGYSGMTIEEVNASYQSLVTQLLEADPEVQIALANAVWYRQGFEVKTPFLQSMENDFSAHIEALDFSQPSALKTINQWASDNTFNKIPKVLDQITPDYVMFLMNALYFKGLWTNPFKEDQTTNDLFYPDAGNPVTVSTMHGIVPVKTYEITGLKAIELNYGRTNFSMVILVPDENLNDFIGGFNSVIWDSVTSSFDHSINSGKMDVAMPRFKFSYEKVLNDQLNALGMTDAFDSDLADLSGISDSDIFVSFVKQNTFVDVNEKGTEAAAVTTIGIVETSMPAPFLVNKPFVFAIRERTTNTILFLGKVELPVY